MNVKEAYNVWSVSYDTVENKTRDLEAKALRASITGDDLEILEIGCGTGKNTEFLQTKARRLIGADFSAEMLSRQLDLREKWNFPADSFDLITCSLALEHIENIDFVFAEAGRVLRAGGRFYFGELHPFKQYQGGKARFETDAGDEFVLECFTHHVSEFFAAGINNNFAVRELKEWFDEDDEQKPPRILTMIFEKRESEN